MLETKDLLGSFRKSARFADLSRLGLKRPTLKIDSSCASHHDYTADVPRRDRRREIAR